MNVQRLVGPGRIPTKPSILKAIPKKYLASKPNAKGIEYRYWRLATSQMDDQRDTSECVGAGFLHNARARPTVIKTPITRTQIYNLAQRLDEWPGENYDGTSVHGGAMAAKQMGLLTSYKWELNADVEKMIAWILAKGPAVIGIDWSMDMFMPLPNGLIVPGGQDAGGHCVLVDGVTLQHGWFEGPNSWGINWGPIKGRYRIRIDDMAKLLKRSGEVCFPVE